MIEKTALTRRSLLGAACLIVPTASVARSEDIAHYIRELTAEVRMNRIGRDLRVSSQLEDASWRYADTLARLQRLSHTADGSTISDRAHAVRYRFRALGENIGWTSRGDTSKEIASDLVRRWMNSFGHRQNILERRFKEIGVGVSHANGRTYAVQFFGTRA